MNNIIKSALASLAILLASSCANEEAIRVACIGDSITEGYGINYQSYSSYPARLDSILGSGYDVLNFGRSATTMMQNGNFPYWSAKEFNNMLAYHADIHVIMLGTNDAKLFQWNAKAFSDSYQAMIDTIYSVNPKSQIYLCHCIPARATKWEITDSVIVNYVNPCIDTLAKNNNLPIIDMYSVMTPHLERIFDDIHPDSEGTKIMASAIAKVIKK
ncbi:MAG: GDSL-type esterase/lipase family protein [Bacteroidia bacterium]|nr:GDSL-type esterase/lipase family protein [Bacteroidia bacterium]